MRGQEYQVKCWENFNKCLETGDSAFKFAHPNSSLFKYFESHADDAAVFDTAMRNFTRRLASSMAVKLDTLFKKMTKMIDVGGGDGTLSLIIMEKHEHLLATSFDLKIVVERAQASLSTQNNLYKEEVLQRLSFAHGNFFEENSIPAQADIYTLKFILHDWSNADSIKILKNIKSAMCQGCGSKEEIEAKRLLIFEMVLPEGNEPFPFKFSKTPTCL